MLEALGWFGDKDPLGRECRRLLRPGGRLIVTAAPRRARLIRRLRTAGRTSPGGFPDYDPWATPEIFARHGFALELTRRFQLGLNRLFVLVKPFDRGGGRARTWPGRRTRPTHLSTARLFPPD
jgi:hypothetical protein